MSGNPFRRPRLPGGGEGPAAVNGAPTAPPKRTKQKRVKIQAPPDSPELTYTPENVNNGRRLSASDSTERAESPPPPPPPPPGFDDREADLESDSATTADSDLEQALENTRRNSGSLPPPAVPLQQPQTTDGMRVPYNPFTRTLATKDAGFGLLGSPRQDAEAEQRQGAGRPALDVDAFKNILLTGSAAPSPPTGGDVNTAARSNLTKPHDSGSSTDTSSLFDPAYSIHPESPRTSFDDYQSASDSDDYENEHSNLMRQGRSDDLAPPAPPKPKSRGPQTVSFAEFDQSIPPGFQAPRTQTPPINAHLTGILRPSLSRTTSDLNKPLPPPPRDAPEPKFPERDPSASPQLTPTVSAKDKKPPPPPPPPSRRQGAESGRARSSSNLSSVTQDSINSETPAESARSSISQKLEEPPISNLAPPPPPARKTHRLSQQPSSGPNSETSSKDVSPSNSTNEVPKLVPPPPPRRLPSNTGKSENSQRPSDPIRPNQSRGDAFLSSLTPAGNVPPAPPPRRGGFKRNSLDGQRPVDLAKRLSGNEHRRTSSTSFESHRSTSVSSLQQVPEPDEMDEQAVVSPPTEDRDILGDMAAFQAEIDAIRAQTEKTR